MGCKQGVGRRQGWGRDAGFACYRGILRVQA